MPHINVNGANIFYEEHGSGGETIVFAHGLLWSMKIFEGQLAALKKHYRVILYDHRGQGQTEVTADGYDMDTLAADAKALIEALNAAPCHFVGLSMGGFVGMRVAARHPELIKSLTLMDTSADPEPTENLGRYGLLNTIARWFGLGLVTSQVMPIMFSPTFLNDPQRREERKFWEKQMAANHRIGVTRAVKGVIERQPIYPELGNITCPTLIIVGEDDGATTPEKAVRIHHAIKGSTLVRLPKVGHMSSIEAPEPINRAMADFYASLPR